VYSEEFACRGYPLAYGRRFVFADTGYEFGADHSLRPLTADEVTETRDLIAARLYCLLELELVQRAWLDPDMLPPPEEFTCLTPTEYAELSAELQRRP
jgi:hypothetical protein